jgi:hypothetical protein
MVSSIDHNLGLELGEAKAGVQIRSARTPGRRGTVRGALVSGSAPTKASNARRLPPRQPFNDGQLRPVPAGLFFGTDKKAPEVRHAGGGLASTTLARDQTGAAPQMGGPFRS